MKIQCDVCEKNEATVVCCADEAVLCAKCDLQVHAANKLATKHLRLQLHSSTKFPTCDICQDKTAFIFCVEDRALFCQYCDESIHSASTLAAKHQRFLATGIRVALNSLSKCGNDTGSNFKEPSYPNVPQIPVKQTIQQPASSPTCSSWAVDDFLELPEFDSVDKMQKEQLELGEFDWWSDVNFFGDQISHEALPAVEVPQLSMSFPSSQTVQYRPIKSSMPNKKPRIEIHQDDDEYSIVPDLG
ncbi:hypothetical protein RND81_05G123600 [Saponaria officinalis]|uniref:B box-type domain-containing protein n=1 Tax=Saponaria officinalis TaxID=3572 RepID=A0AAW1KSH3_SAPOF